MESSVIEKEKNQETSIIFRDDDHRFRYLSDQFRSGDYQRAERGLELLMNDPNADLFSRLLTGTYVDRNGALWVSPDFAIMKTKQQVVDFAFWQLIGLAPEEACVKAGIDRNAIETVEFRTYGESLLPTGQEYSSLDGQSERMEKFPTAVLKLPGLRKINALRTCFQVLPEEITSCKNLRSLSIGNYIGNRLPENFGNLSELEELKVMNTRLESLPESFSNLLKLKRLTLRKTGLTEIPEIIGSLPLLEYLDLSENSIHHVSTVILNCHQLKVLSLEQNKISQLPAELSDRLPLKKIKLKGNPVTKQAQLEQEVHPSVQMVQDIKIENLTTELRLLKIRRKVTPPELWNFSERNVARGSSSLKLDLIPESLRPSAELIAGMLRAMDTGTFAAGFRLLEASGNPALTEACLSALPVLKNGTIEVYGRAQEKKSRKEILFDFLLSHPELVNSGQNSWCSSISNESVNASPSQLNLIAKIFPNLNPLRIDLSRCESRFTLPILPNTPDKLILSEFSGSELILDGMNDEVKELFITGCSTNESLIIRNCNSLKSIEIIDSHIQHLEIYDCPELEWIVLIPVSKPGNRVTRVSVSGCTLLRKIFLEKIKLSGLTIKDCPSLDELYLVGQCTNVRKFKITDCPELKKMSMIAAGLTELPTFLEKVEVLESLNLYRNRITEIGDELDRFKNLTYLNLSGNKLISIPPSITSLNRLEELNIGWQKKKMVTKNLISEVDPVLGALPSLKGINIFLPELKLRKSAVHLKKNRVVLVNTIG